MAAAGSLGDDSWTDGQTQDTHTCMHIRTHTKLAPPGKEKMGQHSEPGRGGNLGLKTSVPRPGLL